ncbi:MAG: hypothetical protein II685_02695, partial [Clostridia bacterium]|nr:hypothetical protein [Clostridia bacterium]
MKKLKLLISAAVCTAMIISMSACSQENGGSKVTGDPASSTQAENKATADEAAKDSENTGVSSSEDKVDSAVSEQTADDKAESEAEKENTSKSESPIVDLEPEYNYMQIYLEFMNNDEWKTYEDVVYPNIDIEKCSIAHYKIFDYDNEGIPELWIFAKDGASSVNEITASAIYTICDGEVDTLLTGSTCGGTMGGNTISFVKDKADGRYYISDTSVVGGFGGTETERVIYNYIDGELSVKSDQYMLAWQNTELGTNEYKIDSKNVTINDFSAAYNAYAEVAPQNV